MVQVDGDECHANNHSLLAHDLLDDNVSFNHLVSTSTAYLMKLTRSDNLCQLASAMCFKVCATIVENTQTALNGKLAILGVLLTHYVKRGRPNLRSHKKFLCAKRWLLK